MVYTPMQGCIGPIGVITATDWNLRCATQFFGHQRTSRDTARHALSFNADRILTLSPVLQSADLSNQPSSVRQGASRGSRVSGNNRRHVGNWVSNSSQTRGN